MINLSFDAVRHPFLASCMRQTSAVLAPTLVPRELPSHKDYVSHPFIQFTTKMDIISRPDHSDLCESLPVKKRCITCLNIYYANASKQYRKRKAALKTNNVEHQTFASEHLENCESPDICKTLPKTKRCLKCVRHYANNKNRASRARKKALLIHTRSKTKHHKYDIVLCEKCVGCSKFTQYCRDCWLKYRNASQKMNRKNKRLKKANENIKDLGPVHIAETCAIVPKKLKNMPVKNNQIQSNDNVSALINRKDYCKENNHKNLPLIAKNSCVNTKKQMPSVKRKQKQQSSTTKKKQKCLNEIDQNITNSPKKILAEKTKRNCTSEMKKKNLVNLDRAEYKKCNTYWKIHLGQKLIQQ